MNRLFRLLAYALALIAVTVLLLIASIAFDSLAGRNRIQTLTNANLPAATTSQSGPEFDTPVDVRAYVARPENPAAAPLPAVIMIHEFWGIQPSILSKADALAAEGYIVVAPDTYRGAVTSWLPRAIYLSATTPTPRVNTDLDTVFAWLRGQPDVDPERIMVMGFCYGGTKALTFSLHNAGIAATGVFYGSLISEPARLQDLPGPVLGIFGAEDQRPSPADVRDFEVGLQAAGIPYEITVYPGVGHAFLGDIESIRADPTQLEAWQQFLQFLEATFSPPSS